MNNLREIVSDSVQSSQSSSHSTDLNTHSVSPSSPSPLPNQRRNHRPQSTSLAVGNGRNENGIDWNISLSLWGPFSPSQPQPFFPEPLAQPLRGSIDTYGDELEYQRRSDDESETDNEEWITDNQEDIHILPLHSHNRPLPSLSHPFLLLPLPLNLVYLLRDIDNNWVINTHLRRILRFHREEKREQRREVRLWRMREEKRDHCSFSF